MNQTLADISVIIPAYNRAGLIGETLQSLLNQTVPATEIIVVDDGSTDDTARVVERIAEELEVRRSEIDDKQGAGSSEQGSLDSRHSPLDSQPAAKPRLRVIRQANAGPGAARNRGVAEATGEFIHFFDSDDIAAPNKHEVQLRALLETGADIAYGPWVKGRFVNLTTEDTENTEEEAVLSLGKPSGAAFSNPSTSELARDSESTSLTRCMTALALDPRRSTLDSGPRNFVPEGPVLQARGLPKGDLVQALLTNWSIVPHACLFRRSILEKAGGFPEDIWVGEDQLLFLRCLLAGAKVVHTPGTMVYYRVGDDPGKLTATGAAQKRHVRDWGRFLLSAKKEIEDRRSAQLSSYCTSRAKEIGEVPAEARRRGAFVGGFGKKVLVGMEVSHGDTANTEEPQGDAPGTCARAAFSNPSTSELARASENTSPTRFASDPALAAEPPRPDYEGLISDSAGGAKALDARLSAIDASTTPSAWFGFRLRAYESWRDLGRFFPDGERELKNELQGIWRKNGFSGFGFQFSGFVLRKWAGLKLRVLGYREHQSYHCQIASKVFLQIGKYMKNKI